MVLLLLVGYDRVAAHAAVRVQDALDRGRLLLAVEGDLRVAVEAPLDHLVAPHRVLGQVLSLYYDLAHGGVTLAVLVGAYLLRPDGYRRVRRALVAVDLAGLALYFVLPVAPPRLLDPARFVDVVALSGTWGASPATQHVDQYGSMPSLHVAWAAWVVLVTCAATRGPVLRTAAAAHLLLTVVVVLVTGNHYVLDVVGGAALALACWSLAGAAPRTPAAAGSATG